MQLKSIIAGTLTAAVMGVFVVYPAIASANGNSQALGYGYGYGSNERPGWGYGDKNHEHTGPPGLEGKEKETPPGHENKQAEDSDTSGQSENQSGQQLPGGSANPDAQNDSPPSNDNDDREGGPGNGKGKGKQEGFTPPGLAKKRG